MNLDDPYGYSGERPITAREYFRGWANVTSSEADLNFDSVIIRRWLNELMEFLDSEPTIQLPMEDA